MLNKRDRSLFGSRSEAQKIFNQRQTIKRLEKKNQELKNQQKEFIQWLEKEIVDSMVGGIQQYYAKNHLKIYKEIIGDKYE